MPQIHARGLKFGMYTNIASVTCMHYPGSKGHFHLDAQSFAEWGVDYLKVDGCFVSEEDLNRDYIKLGLHLNKTGRPMVYSCSWPYYIQYIINKKPDYTKIQAHCNLWRNYHDVMESWKSVVSILEHYKKEYDIISKYHGPGHWNDPDMLLLGTGALSDGRSRIQLSVYAMMSAPLLLSCDMKKITSYEKELLQNEELVAIAQDTLGIMARPYSYGSFVTLWVKPHLPMKGDKYLSYSFALVNLDNDTGYPTSFTPSSYNLTNPDGYTVMDVFTKNYIQNISLQDSLSFTVPPTDIVFYKLYPL